MAGRQAFKQHYPTYHPKAPPTPYRVERGCQLVIVITPLREIHVQVGLAPTPPGLDLRRAPRIVRDLPPSFRIPCRGSTPSSPTCGSYSRAEYGRCQRKTPEDLGGAWPFGVGQSRSPGKERLCDHTYPNKTFRGFFT